MKSKSRIIQNTLFAIVTMLITDIAFASSVTVTTYVTKVQEERQSTRWTLTEWLRIKERMKLMDVWMAMFSNPAKDKFRPELNISYLLTQSSVHKTSEDGTSLFEGTSEGYTGKAQFWATNLVSSTLGVRTLNIDFGVEGGEHNTGKAISIANQAAVINTNSREQSARTTWYTANLRLFGKSIQDSSLVVKYGMMSTKNHLQLSEDDALSSSTAKPAAASASGAMAGAELQLYLMSWLGGEATYHQYMPVHVAYSSHTLAGTYAEASGFIEVSLLRLMVGRYEERWQADWTSDRVNTREHGYIAGVKVSI
jgi:hypothetical protein